MVNSPLLIPHRQDALSVVQRPAVYVNMLFDPGAITVVLIYRSFDPRPPGR